MTKCKRCGEELIQKSRLWLVVVGFGMIGIAVMATRIQAFFIPALLLTLAGFYLLIWATAGRGQWCRRCKIF